jgi:hypothetical protein
VPVHAIKRHRGVEVQLHLFLILALMKVSGQLHDPAALPLGKVAFYQLSERLVGPQIWSGHLEISLPPSKIRTTLSRLYSPYSCDYTHYAIWATP